MQRKGVVWNLFQVSQGQLGTHPPKQTWISPTQMEPDLPVGHLATQQGRSCAERNSQKGKLGMLREGWEEHLVNRSFTYWLICSF